MLVIPTYLPTAQVSHVVCILCRESNPHIKQWMKDNNYTDYSKLEQYYETR